MSSYFEIFGISPIRLGFSSTELETKFHELALKNHPDKNQNSVQSVKISAEINLAYKVLRDPWTRSLYVLGRFGLVQSSKIPPALADAYFELQDLNDRSKLEDLRAVLAQDRVERSMRLTKFFESFDQIGLKTFDPQNSEALGMLKDLQDLVLENTYCNSMLRDIDQRLGTLAA
jgi:curved DNA-binding protein CbpA